MKSIVRYAVLFTFLVLTSSFITPVRTQQLVFYYDLEGDNDAYDNLKETVAVIKGMSEEQLQENGIVTAFIKKTGNLHVLTITLSDSWKEMFQPYSLKAFLQKVSIPECIETIGEEAFEGCVKLTSIKIPNSVTSIGRAAFLGSGLTSVEIPDSVTSIGESTFQFCEKLTSIKIPNSVTSIGWEAFSDCNSLTSLMIPISVTTIDGAVVNPEFTAIKLPEENSCFQIDGCLLLSKNGETLVSLIKPTKDVIIPGTVKIIGKNAFRRSNLTGVIIPNSVTTIEDNAFSDCQNLTSIEIPNSVTSIGNGAFYGSGLTSVVIPNSVMKIGRSAFSSTHQITIPNSLVIGNDAVPWEAFPYDVEIIKR